MIRSVLFDRDGTLIADGTSFALMPYAAGAVGRLREQGVRIGVVTNQPRVGTDPVARRAMQSLHERIQACVGALDGWFVCTHTPQAQCTCRKPQPGLIQQALRTFGARPHECVVIGDIGSDMEAAERAGAIGILVPTRATRQDEIARAPIVRANLREAVAYVLAERAA